MTQFFTQNQIDGLNRLFRGDDVISVLRECFNMYSEDGLITSSSQLRYMMRCLGYPVTQQQSIKHYDAKSESTLHCQYEGSEKNLDFAAFLEVVHEEESSGNPSLEVSSFLSPHAQVIRALRGLDREGNRAISVQELRVLLTHVGEKMSGAEVNAVLKEVAVGQIVPHHNLLQLLCPNSPPAQ